MSKFFCVMLNDVESVLGLLKGVIGVFGGDMELVFTLSFCR